MSQSLSYDESKLDENVEIEIILKTPGDSDVGNFSEVE